MSECYLDFGSISHEKSKLSHDALRCRYFHARLVSCFMFHVSHVSLTWNYTGERKIRSAAANESACETFEHTRCVNC